ncbi:MAG TPA: hypothetical protein VFW07_16245 [Parafilimonas sp.]|nr:hypothetical protein [Parafilimonas sp.]
MSTIWIAAILIAIIVIPSFIFIRLHKKREKKQREALLAQFTKAGVTHNLFFAHREMLKDKMLGLDAVHQKLLVFPFEATDTEVVVDLTGIESCAVHKEYSHVILSDKKNVRSDQVLMQIALKIEFSTNMHPLLIGFFDNRSNDIYEIPELEKKAKEWAGLIGQEVARKKSNRA